MNLIDKQTEKIAAQKRLGLMTHVVVGYPSLEETIRLVKLMAKVGVDMVELQIPFSDPLADGPTIMKACETVLENGVRVRDAFKIAKRLSKEVDIPLLFMAYFNTVFKYGTEKFCKDAKRVGISGLIVPDIPLEEEEREHFMGYCNRFGLYHIRVVSPASTKERLQKNSKVANGFVYCIAHQGITGVKDSLDPSLASYLKQVRKEFRLPLAVGFGISKKEHIEMLKPYADIVVVGSAVIDLINNTSGQNYPKSVEYFLKQLVSIKGVN